MEIQTDTTMNASFDLPEKGVDLAKLVFDVAKECDRTRFSGCSIDLDSFKDEIMSQLKICRVQHENSHLPEAEIQKLVESIIAENKRKKEELAAERAAKREKVQQRINGNALEGYELAYSLCKNDDSDKAKWFKYLLVNHLPSLPSEEKIEICRMYAESLINLGQNGNNIAKVYCHMAGLVYPQYKRMDCSLCLSFYEKAYEYIDEPTWMLDEIIAFCNRFGIDELRVKCQQKKEALQSAKESSKNSSL